MRERDQISRAFGQVLRELRKGATMSQEKLGAEAGVDRVYVSLLERGERSPSLPVIVELAKALGTSASEIVALVELRVNRR